MAVYSLSGQRSWPGTFIPNVACEEVQYETSIGMTIDRYVQFDSSNHKFDGAMARKHLEKNLAMMTVSYGDDKKITADFNAWFGRHERCIAIHPNGPVLIAPLSV